MQSLYYIQSLIVMIPDNSSDRLPLKSVTGSKASIFVRKTLRILPCEIKKLLLFTAHRKDLRFSMKMMFAPDHETPIKPV